jgi:hypothetical protein
MPLDSDGRKGAAEVLDLTRLLESAHTATHCYSGICGVGNHEVPVDAESRPNHDLGSGKILIPGRDCDRKAAAFSTSADGGLAGTR